MNDTQRDDNYISLKAYMETLFRAHDTEHKLIEIALEKAEIAMTHRLDSMNEFQKRIDRLESTFATKESIKIFDKFISQFWGFVAGVTVLNAIISFLIVKLMGGGG